MGKVFLRKQFSDYLGENRAILDIASEFLPDVSPTPSITPSITPSRTPSITPTPSKLYATVFMDPRNSLNTDSYTPYINGSADGTWNDGSRSYEQGTTIRIDYTTQYVCNATLNGSAYSSGTVITLNGNSTYTFTMLNVEHYVDYGTPYCQGNVYTQGTINDCGTQSSYQVDDCSCACNQACNGTYYSDYICVGTTKRFVEKYYCNNAATGNTYDVTCSGDCGASTSQVQGSQIGTYYTCNGGVTATAVYQNSNGCYTCPNIYLVGGTWQSTNPSKYFSILSWTIVPSIPARSLIKSAFIPVSFNQSSNHLPLGALPRIVVTDG